MSIKYVTETHIHADFASGAHTLAEQTGAELAVSSYDEGQQYRYSMEHHALRDGDELFFSNTPPTEIYTPGHTPEHLSFVLLDNERSAHEPIAIFTGDFLFVGSLGRPDLLGEEAKQQLAHELYRSLHSRIASLPDGVQVYPGHGAGSLCGSGMSDRAESTLGYERTIQPLFRLNEEDFVREVLDSVPPMPSYYPRMKDLNAKGACSVAHLPEGQALSPAQLSALLSDHTVTVIDLRRPEAFGGAHIPGAINIGAGQNLSLWAGWIIAPESRLVLVSDQGDDEASRRALARVGLDRIEGFLQKGMPAWIDAGLDFTRTCQMSTKEVTELRPDTRILDVRNEKEWADGHIAGAIHISLGELPGRTGEIPKDSSIVTVCGSGYRSSVAASLLEAQGFEDVSSMDSGMTAWNRIKLPTVRR